MTGVWQEFNSLRLRRMSQSEAGPEVFIRTTHRINRKLGNTKRRLWVNAMVADHISHAGDDQNQAIRARFQKFV